MKLISLVICCYNGEKFVKECFDKSYIDNDAIEYLFVDDGSTDNSVKIAEEIAAKHSNVRIIKKPHTGYTDTCAVGVRESQGKFFFFLDIDDWFEKRILLEALETIRANKDLDIVLYDYSTDFASGKKSFVTNLKKFITPDKITCVEEFKKMPLPVYFMNHNILIKKDIVKDFEWPDATLYSDSNLVLYALVHSKQIYFSRKVLYHYIIGIKGQTTTFANTTKNYNEYYKNIKFLDHYFKDEFVKTLTRKKRKLIYHTTFLYIANIIFVTFFNYTKERKQNYVALKKEFKRRTPKIYRAVYYRSPYFIFEKLPKICLTPICKFIHWTLRNKVPWEQ